MSRERALPEKSPTPFDLKGGTVLRGRYEIKRPHRQGGMATTFEIDDREAGVRREMQVFPAGLFEDAGQAREFAESLRAWVSIESPAVLQVREVELYDDGTLLLVTDFPPGRSLRELLKERGRLAPALVRTIGLSLLEGLEVVHAAGQVHGDVKPQTIRVDPKSRDMHPVLVDGGITLGLWSAKHLGDKTALIGTPFYAPVEQFGGEPPDVQSDVYNVATVLYELLTGVVPWPGTSFLEIFQAKLAQTPPRVAARAPDLELPAGFEAAVLGGLMTDRRERYPSARAFHDRLRAVEAR